MPDLRLKCCKCHFRWGCAIYPLSELTALPRSPSCIQGDYLYGAFGGRVKGREEKRQVKGRGREREENGMEGEGEWREDRRGEGICRTNVKLLPTCQPTHHGAAPDWGRSSTSVIVLLRFVELTSLRRVAFSGEQGRQRDAVYWQRDGGEPCTAAERRSDGRHGVLQHRRVSEGQRRRAVYTAPVPRVGAGVRAPRLADDHLRRLRRDATLLRRVASSPARQSHRHTTT